VLPTDLTRALDDLATTPKLLVVSDFDGTLAPIVNDPLAARALPAAAQALTGLADLPDTSAALVSGRALGVLRELSAMPPTVHLVGSHGAEFGSVGQERSDSGNVQGFTQDVDEALLQRVIGELNAIAVGRPGVTVETKPASAALHVRNASPADAEAALEAARRAATAWDVHATAGKAVLEFAVVSTDKGHAVDVLRDQIGATAVLFLGDDVTDEKAFRRMRDGDVGVKVGPGDTAAAFRVDAPDDVADALAHVLAVRGVGG
jgi:trehalose 6-phosphate phosphatase